MRRKKLCGHVYLSHFQQIVKFFHLLTKISIFFKPDIVLQIASNDKYIQLTVCASKVNDFITSHFLLLVPLTLKNKSLFNEILTYIFVLPSCVKKSKAFVKQKMTVKNICASTS